MHCSGRHCLHSPLDPFQIIIDRNMPDYFRVYYSRDPNKKKKIFSEGVLACESKRTRLFDQEGQLIYTHPAKSTLTLGEDYILAYKFAINVDQLLSAHDFLTGQVFLQPQPPHKPIRKIKNITLKKDQVKKWECGLEVEMWLLNKLRLHQVEGVLFMYECLMGLRRSDCEGCILADFMGLGKTLQTLCLFYSLLRMGVIESCVVVCPLSVVGVWEKECGKWLEGRLTGLVCLGTGQETLRIVREFTSNKYRLIIMSYECFSRNIDQLRKRCDLLVLDEGHRLKNRKTKLCAQLIKFTSKKRLLLTGTPIQNNLVELYTCASIVNPNIFPSLPAFRNIFIEPILKSVGVAASEKQKQIGRNRATELANKLKTFCLRRRADVLEQYLPEKREFIVVMKLTNIQKTWYDRCLKRKVKDSEVLSFLNFMRKLFTHPKLLKNISFDGQVDCRKNYLSEEEISYKLKFVVDMSLHCQSTGSKVVIVSYFTQSLDLIGNILTEAGVSYAQVDGRTDGKHRHNVLGHFKKDKTVLLLSGKAGGTGLTITCASRLIILEPDWNPSNDSQVMGRVWRQGQEHAVQIYRLVMVSSFQEKIMQRQCLKRGLSEQLIDEKDTIERYDFLSLKNLFVRSSEESIMYKEEGNKLAECKKEMQWINWEGVVHVQMNKSHLAQNSANEFELLQFDQQESSQEEEDQGEEESANQEKQESANQEKQESTKQEKQESKQEEEEGQKEQKLERLNSKIIEQKKEPNKKNKFLLHPCILKQSPPLQVVIDNEKGKSAVITKGVSPALLKIRR